jgi:hypothetical protein
MCSNFAAQNTPRWHFQNKRCGTSGNQLKKMTFFTLPHPPFTEEYPGFGLCTLIEPEGLSTNLHVFANEQTHIKWNFARIKSSTTALQPGSNFYKFKRVMKTIEESVLSQYNNNNHLPPETNCRYA